MAAKKHNDVTIEDCSDDEEMYSNYNSNNNNNNNSTNNNKNNNTVNNNNSEEEYGDQNNNNNNRARHRNLKRCYVEDRPPVNIQVTAKVLFGSVTAISALSAERKKKPSGESP